MVGRLVGDFEEEREGVGEISLGRLTVTGRNPLRL
jgi:hypothetical protein